LPPLRRSLIVAVQAAFLVAVIWFAYDRIAEQWAGAPVAGLDLRWGWIGAAAALVLATYGLLIQVWVAHLRAWGVRLPFGQAARLWFVANLGRYIPGKIWGLGTMAVMARQRNVAPVAALGSSITVMGIGMVAGFAVVVATGAGVIDAVLAEGGVAAPPGAVAGAALVAVLLLAATPLIVPRLIRVASRSARPPIAPPDLAPRSVWLVAVGTAMSWILYGIAFSWFVRGILDVAAGGVAGYIAVYTASYLLGLIALIPGGIGVREGGLVLGLEALGLATAPEALLLAVTSRIWLTILEIVPGTVLLLVGTRPPASGREASARP
jgi:uncharacterized membrane protein YbhN (UPF0104 family)